MNNLDNDSSIDTTGEDINKINSLLKNLKDKNIDFYDILKQDEWKNFIKDIKNKTTIKEQVNKLNITHNIYTAVILAVKYHKDKDFDNEKIKEAIENI